MRFLLALLLACVSTADAQTIDVDLGGLVLSLSESQTAQIFHIVDQLAEWDAFAHRAYVRWGRTIGLTDEDRRLLRRHGEMRRVRGRGRGFEQAFLVDDTIDGAASRAAAAGVLSADEASAERMILGHFAPKVAPLIDQQRSQLAAFKNQLVADRERLRPVIQRLARFVEAKATVKVPVFLVANPEATSGGGGADGGRLVVEVPGPGPTGVLLHEALHAFLVPHTEAIRSAAASVGLSQQTLNEGIAYAFAPGLTDDGRGVDQLAEGLSRYVIQGTPPTDAYVQYYMLASVIRPVLRASLEQGESIGAFLPKAVQKWRTVAPK